MDQAGSCPIWYNSLLSFPSSHPLLKSSAGAKFDTQEGGNRDSHTQTIMIGVVTSETWMLQSLVMIPYGWFMENPTDEFWMPNFHDSSPNGSFLISLIICFPTEWHLWHRILWGFDQFWSPTPAISDLNARWMKRMRVPANGWMRPSTVTRCGFSMLQPKSWPFLGLGYWYWRYLEMFYGTI